MPDGFAVRRADGAFYAGTQDSKPLYVNGEESAARFAVRADAELRASSLAGEHEVVCDA